VHGGDKTCTQNVVGIPQDLGVGWIINNINMNRRKIKCEGTKWIQLAHNRSNAGSCAYGNEQLGSVKAGNFVITFSV
jgi:hypothetical protein